MNGYFMILEFKRNPIRAMKGSILRDGYQNSCTELEGFNSGTSSIRMKSSIDYNIYPQNVRRFKWSVNGASLHRKPIFNIFSSGSIFYKHCKCWIEIVSVHQPNSQVFMSFANEYFLSNQYLFITSSLKQNHENFPVFLLQIRKKPTCV